MNKLCLVFLIGFLVNCSNYGQLTFVTKLPKKLDENSGIVSMEDSKIWVIEDNGNPDNIYEVGFNGDLLKEFKVSNAKNKDWEDLTKDEEGNLYIGDMGNNDNDRKDLVIYKIPNPVNEPGDKIEAEEIRYYYPEQKEFPPDAKNFIYDAEALFHSGGALFVITKNGARPFNGQAMVYKIPAQAGNHKAQLVSAISLCGEPHSCRVTGAAASPDQKTVVLLGYGKIWVFTDFKANVFTEGSMRTIDLGATTQLEAVCFMNDSTLLISDEQSHGTGRNLYSYSLGN
ncbi:MAG TPA: hypothetical protein VKN36_17500 [Eudoraea sp.]|nr:hypothetical protein [Eudoraea sp.]